MKVVEINHKQILKWIDDFYKNFSKEPKEQELLRKQYMNGYCYFFAKTLQAAFRRGDVCVCAPFGHFVWKDIDGIIYDAEGISSAEFEYTIPEKFMGDMVKDFLHVDGVSFHATEKEIEDLIHRYKIQLMSQERHIRIAMDRIKKDFEKGYIKEEQYREYVLEYISENCDPHHFLIANRIVDWPMNNRD